MKKATLTLSLLMAVLYSAFAGNASHFNFNEAEMKQSLRQVKRVADIVKEHPGMTYEQVPHELKQNITNTPVIKGVTELDFDTASFLLGVLAGCALVGGTILLIGLIGY